MAMFQESADPYTVAKGGCYLCTSPNQVVYTDAVIEGEGNLVICVPCIFDLGQLARQGRATMASAEKRRAKQEAAA
jgi:hypothetical protein